MSRSLNKATLIGNLTRDPELRFTPQGTAVCTFGLATNRQWTTESGEKKEDVEFHRIVAWNKLAELCSQLLAKGRKVYVEGRLQTRNWNTQEGDPRSTTEVVISNMIILDPKRDATMDDGFDYSDKEILDEVPSPDEDVKESKSTKKATSKKAEDPQKATEADDDEIPF